MHPAILAVLYIALTAGPIAIAAIEFPARRSMINELASGLGLAAFSILLVEFALSGRFQAVSGKIGIDVTMRFHQLLARTAAVFALLHPFLYRGHLFRRERPWDTQGLESFGLDFAAFSTGLLAWILILLLVLTAIWRDQLPYRYETWRLMHGLGAAVIVGLVAHHAWTAGRYSGHAPLSWVWVGLVALAALTLLAVYIGRPLRRLTRPYAVSSVRKIADRTWELVIAAKRGRGVPFTAGQFVWLNVGHSPFSLYENPFSIASAPDDGKTQTFVIKEVGDFTRSLDRLSTGTRAHIDGPYGNLTIKGREADGIGLIAGGVGVAPMLSVLRQMHMDSDTRPAILLYGNRHRGQIVYEDELATMSRELPLQVVHVLSEPAADWGGRSGVLDPATIKDVYSFDGVDRWLFLLCGPSCMIEAAESALIELGVPASRILSERFQYD